MQSDYFLGKNMEEIISLAFVEDFCISGDITTRALVEEEFMSEANFIAKSDCVIAGIKVAHKAFELYVKKNTDKVVLEWYVSDGDYVKKNTTIGKVTGKIHVLLACERTVLNFMQRMSGIATKTRTYADIVKPYDTKILDTRKTVPGLRILDKLAVKIGGGFNHRIGLYDQFLIKDNHIKACNNDVCDAIMKVHKFMLSNYEENIPIIVEIADIEQIKQIFDNNLDKCITRLLLDNMVKINDDNTINVDRLKNAVDYINGRVKTEASGNINEFSLNAVASTGVNYISCGSLTHSVIASDISMKII